MVAIGTGAVTRQPSLTKSVGTLGGSATPDPSAASDIAAANERGEGLDASPSDDAQQLSASACVKSLAWCESCAWRLCIGHSGPSAQQAIRSSGVAAHPAQTAIFPAIRPRLSRTADRR